jgi:protein-S-isoprenylcysteine O-methyltransferase Ste14
MDENITENKLKTDGIYSWVRNPMYTGCWFIMIGITFMWHNYFVLPMIPIDWIILTVVLINTEEKWLLKVYGNEYAEYKKRVNRCIPWFPKQKRSKEK